MQKRDLFGGCIGVLLACVSFAFAWYLASPAPLVGFVLAGYVYLAVSYYLEEINGGDGVNHRPNRSAARPADEDRRRRVKESESSASPATSHPNDDDL